jgi:hypothetical protein
MTHGMADNTDLRLIAADKVEGTSVYNRQGEKLGDVENVFIDKVSGQAEFATMAFGGVIGVGHKHHPLPWSVLTYDTTQNGFVVDLDKRVLESAPSYESDHLAGEDRSWGAEVRNYYGAI